MKLKNPENTPKIREFSANKKWAVSPLISPPAGALTATQADKFVCIFSIGQNGGIFNEKERKPGIRAGGAVLVSPALQRGVSVPAMTESKSRRDGAFSSLMV
jgi:hypothetical protein